MTKILTRASARQAQARLKDNYLNPVKECSSDLALKLRREIKTTTVLSDESDSDSSYRIVRDPSSTYDSDDSDSDYCSIKSTRKSKSSVKRDLSTGGTRRDIAKSQTFSKGDHDGNILKPPKKDKKSGQTKKNVTKSDDLNDESLYNSGPKLSTPRKQKLRHSGSDDISYVSPTKQKKLNDNLPQTPQHQKIEQNEVQTPSHLFVKLQLTSPKHMNEVTPNRKQLFKDTSEMDASAENVKQLIDVKPKKVLSVYQNAKKALHSTYPTEMPSREKELGELKEFIQTHIKNKTSGSLYVSGPPGTGKSASLNVILQEENISSGLRKVYVNCTAIKSPTAIFSRITKELGIKVCGKTEKDYSAGVENFLKRQNKMILLVLDEIDQLENKNQSVLYTIFEWPAKPNTKLILVGIANALDLTDRTLPRLQARCELKPELLHFPPYTKQQIVQIFTSRLKSAGVLDVFSPIAIQMLAGKVAAVSGDVRRALDIGRRVVELVERSRKEETLKSIENLANEIVEEKPKTVDLKQVINVLNNVYGTSQNLSDDTDESFPLQQKIVICSLILMLKKARNKDVTVGKLHEVYKRVCTKRNILSVDQAEFVGLCSLIETRGILRVTGKKEPRLQKVNLVWDEEEVAACLKDKQLMSSILQDESCLGKM